MTNIREILPIQSVSRATTEMYMFLIQKLTEMGIPYETERGNIYAVKRTTKEEVIPCFVSHIDTVHKLTDEIHVLEFHNGRILTGFNRIKNNQTGIGGDDKVGIYYCLRALEELNDVKVAFFRDEEIGCIGSSDANMSFFDDVSMVLQGDRKGNKDFVTKIQSIDLSGKDFQNDVANIVTTHGYSFCTLGGTTDVGQLRKNGITVPVVNISCGYFNPHTAEEYIDMVYAENGLDMFLEIAKTYGNEYYHIDEYKPYVYTAPKTTYVPPKTTYVPPKTTYVPPKTTYGPPKITTTTEPVLKSNVVPDKEDDISYDEFVYCDEVGDLVSIRDVVWSEEDDEYILITSGKWTSPNEVDTLEDLFDYYEIEITPGYYDGVIVRKNSTRDEIIESAISDKIVSEVASKNIIAITKINREIFLIHYGDEKKI